MNFCARSLRGGSTSGSPDSSSLRQGGNPLALLELPRGMSAAQLAGGFGLPGALSLEGRIQERLTSRFDHLPPSTKQLLLVAAAEPAGDPALVWAAAGRLGIDQACGLAESEGLLDLGTRVTFRHPLVRSAIYRSASAEQRRLVHRALADVTDAQVDPDRRAWHLAAAISAPDDGVADELERAAGRAQARGGLAAGAAFLERAAVLTIEPSRRAQRALAAGQAKLKAGLLNDATTLSAVASAAAEGRSAACRSGPLASPDCVRVASRPRRASVTAAGGPRP